MQHYRRLVEIEADYITSRQDSSSDERTAGFIFHTADTMVPYFANQAATALALMRDDVRLPVVTRYLGWYFRNLNWPDELGLYGTMYDYRRTDGEWQPDLAVRAGGHKHYYDSADAYAATFLTLLRAYAAAGGDTYLLVRQAPQIEAIAGLMVNLADPSDGLTIAKPTYPVKYLMDNCEVFKGLRDAAWLFHAVLGDPQAAAYYEQVAARTRSGILTSLANGPEFYYYRAGKHRGAVNWTKWYPDVVSQLFPALFGVIAPNDPRAVQAYQRLNHQFPRWHTFSAPHTAQAPWALVAYAATVLGFAEHFERYRTSAEAVYLATGHPGRWNIAESAWFLMACLHTDYLSAGWGGYP